MEKKITFPFGPVEVARDGGMLPLLEMANNHQGDVEHGKRIAREMAAVCRERGVQAGMKLQFRRCDVYLHPGYAQWRGGELSNPLATRFTSTSLSYDQYYEIVCAIREVGLIPFSTPWDEPTVEWCDRMDLPVIKVASCFCSDVPLLRAIAETRRPVVASVGGASTYEVDRLVEIFRSENLPLALLHCIALYPTPIDKLAGDQVRQLRQRYPDLVIGYSGHEAPTDLTAVTMAVTAGAAIVERHVGVPTETITLNKYSMNPEQVGRWLDRMILVHKGTGTGRSRPVIEGEAEALGRIQRGIYARRTMAPGEFLKPEDILLAMPRLPGQFAAGDIDEVCGQPAPARGLQPMMPIWCDQPGQVPPEIRASSIRQRVREVLDHARINLAGETEAVIQHFHGLDRFDECGGVLINIVNREYCKMLIVMLSGQSYPMHSHQQKEETFHLLAGELEVTLGGEERTLKAGDSVTIQRGQRHAFRTKTGMVLEEISTTYIQGDSLYEDGEIPTDSSLRKTTIVL